MSNVNYKLTIDTSLFSEQSKKAQDKFLEEFKTMDSKLLKQQEDYYNSVKAQDQNYYNWKAAKIRQEAENLGLSEKQKQLYIKETFDKLEKEQKEATAQKPDTGGFIQAWGMATLAITGTISMIKNAWSAFAEFFESANRANLALKGLSETARVFGQDSDTSNKYA